jgi:hypothetical protein
MVLLSSLLAAEGPSPKFLELSASTPGREAFLAVGSDELAPILQ